MDINSDIIATNPTQDEPVALISYQYTGDFPDLLKIYCNGRRRNLSSLESPLKQQAMLKMLQNETSLNKCKDMIQCSLILNNLSV